MPPNKEIDILLKFITDAQSISALEAAADNLDRHFEKVEKRIQSLRKEATQLKQVAQDIQQASRQLLLLGTAGTVGIFAAANKYVENAKTATQLTKEWKKAQDDLTKSGERFGAVAAEAALPVLKKAAEVAAQAAAFVEKHPDVVRAALNTGLVVATLGAVGVAVSKGIKIYADLQTLAAFALQAKASKDQLKAGEIMAAAAAAQLKAAGLQSATDNAPRSVTGGGLGTVLGAATLIGIGTIAAKYATDLVNNVLQRTGIMTQIQDAQKELAKKGRLYPGISTLGNVDRFGNPKSTDSSVPNTPLTGVQASSMFDTILKAYDDYKTDDLKLVQDHYKERNDIVASSLKAEADANKQYAAAVAKVNSGTASALGSLATDFARSNAKAEQQYQDQRAKIIADGAESIEDIQKASQERIRKITQSHNDRVEELTAARDALGLAKENRQFKRDIRDEKKDAKEEVKQRREEIAQRLADLKQSYEQERAERLADYIARVAEIKAQAAERLKELAIEHQEELQQIREQKAAKLKELDQEFNDERKRRYAYLVQQIKDLDAGLFTINKLEAAYMTARVAEIQRIIDTANAAAVTANTAYPGRASGGYTSGLVMTGEQGVEYVMSNRTTKAAESVIGGRLTQEGLLSALRSGGKTVNYNGRFSGEYTAGMRRAVQRDAQKAVLEAFG